MLKNVATSVMIYAGSRIEDCSGIPSLQRHEIMKEQKQNTHKFDLTTATKGTVLNRILPSSIVTQFSEKCHTETLGNGLC